MFSHQLFHFSLWTIILLAFPGQAIEKEEVDKAIERGIQALKTMQNGDGSWNYAANGATSLAGVALLECDVKPTDKCIQSAAEYLRKNAAAIQGTYSVALAIVFFDRLGDPLDVPLIEFLMVRLLAGQSADGRWGYECPPLGAAESNRLSTHLKTRAELKGGKELPRPGKRTLMDLPPEIRQQLISINRGETLFTTNSDNSNTQFATLALWVGRRHGFPVERALARLEQRMRFTQAPGGTWDYHWDSSAADSPGPATSGSPSMTCAGVLALTVAHGASHDPDVVKVRAPLDPTRDLALQKALLALGSSIGNPVGKIVKPGKDSPIPIIDETNGKSYYFLWSLERVAVALNLEAINKKDWYSWGAEVIIANQAADGSWNGEYGRMGGADTSFALMFLRRANLLKDLSSNLKGRVKDPATVVLRSGGVGGVGLTGLGKGLKPALGPQGKHEDNRPKETPKMKPIPDRVEITEADELGNKLVEAKSSNQDAVLKELKEGKGGKYTDALSLAIPRLQGELREKARDSLAERLTRMSAKTLGDYMKDTDPEIRRGALMASYMKDLREHIPLLIERLDDKDAGVSRAAQVALKEMTKQDFGPEPGSTREEHEKAVADWKAWWKKQEKR